jgi:hypothetical protein
LNGVYHGASSLVTLKELVRSYSIWSKTAGEAGT